MKKVLKAFKSGDTKPIKLHILYVVCRFLSQFPCEKQVFSLKNFASSWLLDLKVSFLETIWGKATSWDGMQRDLVESVQIINSFPSQRATCICWENCDCGQLLGKWFQMLWTIFQVAQKCWRCKITLVFILRKQHKAVHVHVCGKFIIFKRI